MHSKKLREEGKEIINPAPNWRLKRELGMYGRSHAKDGSTHRLQIYYTTRKILCDMEEGPTEACHQLQEISLQN